MAKIAIVDDSEIALDWAKETLSKFGHEVATYNKSIGVTGFVRACKPDLLLLDVNMGDGKMQGDMICKLLRQDPTTKGLVVALYSGMDEGELATLASEVGADGYIPKTEDVNKLHDMVTRYIKN